MFSKKTLTVTFTEIDHLANAQVRVTNQLTSFFGKEIDTTMYPHVMSVQIVQKNGPHSVGKCGQLNCHQK